MKPLIVLQGVSKHRFNAQGVPDFTLLMDDLTITAGQKIAILGPSGSGKSTLVDLLTLSSQPSGCARFCFHPPPPSGADIGMLWGAKSYDILGDLRKRYIGIILQAGGLLRFATLRRNIELPRRLLGLPKDDTVDQLAERLGIQKLLDRLPGSISVGERQRAAIARALSHQPSLVIADEPTASLDQNNAQKVMSLLLELVDDAGVTLILTSHDRPLMKKNGLQLMTHSPLQGDGNDYTHSTFRLADPEEGEASGNALR